MTAAELLANLAETAALLEELAGTSPPPFAATYLRAARVLKLGPTDGPIQGVVLDELKDTLLVSLVLRCGGQVAMPAAEVDAAGGHVLTFGMDRAGVCQIEASAKQ